MTDVVEDVYIYPKPVLKGIEVHFSKALSGDVFLYNYIGKRVMAEKLVKKTTLSIEALNQGVYFVNYKGDNRKSKSFKIVVVND